MLASLSACNYFRTDEPDEGEVIARVYDRYLYRDDIRDILPANVNEVDSAALVQNYINVWAKDQLMIYKAEYNLNEQQKDFEEQITAYRNDLLKFTYRQKYIEQNLDTNISESSIREFYTANPGNFMLRENIVKTRFVIVSQDAPRMKEAREWFASAKASDEEALRNYALQYARQFSLEDTNWVSYDWLAKQIPPMPAQGQAEFLRANNRLEMQDSSNIYLVEFREYRLKDGLAPLSYSHDLIRNLLLNQRKLDLLSDLEKNLLEDAIEKEEFETY